MDDNAALYTAGDKKIMGYAGTIRRMNKGRIDEIKEWARISGVGKIGIAYCVSYKRQADALEKVFQDAGFGVEKVHCKYGMLQASELIPGEQGVMCNPAGQARCLAGKDTGLNIVLGLCLGHDMVFNAHSVAPVTTLAVKDRRQKSQQLPGL
jgi:uncharacterized metal-binding protein